MFLVFYVCMENAPHVCNKHTIATEHNCTMQAQIPLSLWVNEHPGWRIKKWQCTSNPNEDI